ncbi:MAG: RidA family protein [Candidatus Tectomicrobia bacterium]|uniref:RidA family protein n=1 Tax=Tectimicrobiota bacterium TaxID=2528274 RepID=A0A932ZVQ6_UNCTE|nr:RidA family protein [Candidatus Tectomicrobia bacterium]
MVELVHLWPPGMFCRAISGKPIYSSVTVVKASDHARIILAGQVSARPDGELVGKGDMAAQIRRVCESIRAGLEHVGAGFRDVVRTVTYTVDVSEYFRCQGVRFEYFAPPLPPSTLLGVSRLADPDFLVEIEAEAVVPLERLRNA